jgi:DNA-binding GntR family transcriptional regulator
MASSTTQPRLQLKDEAATHIRELIVSGQVAPGELVRLAPLVEDAYLVQAFVVGELAARAALVIDDDQIAALRLMDEEINAHTQDDAGFLERANYDLHNAVYAVADSDRLTWFVRSASRFVPRRFWGMIPGWLEHNRSGHAPVIDALEAHDPAAARLAMSSHIEFAGQLLLRHLDSIGFWAVDQPS